MNSSAESIAQTFLLAIDLSPIKQQSPDRSELAESGLGCSPVFRQKLLPPIVLQLANALSISTPWREIKYAAIDAWQDAAIIPQLAKKPTASFPSAHLLPLDQKFFCPNVVLAELLI
jgi:hypothetical protein